MRILWLTPYIPLPIFGGGTRVFNMIRVLSKACDIDLLASSDAPEQADDSLGELRSLCCSVKIVPSTWPHRTHKRLMQLRALIGRRPSQYMMFYSQQMQDRINQALRENHYDVVILEQSFMGYYTLPGKPPIVLDQQNVESDVLRRASKHERSWLRRAYNWLAYLRFLPDERQICRNAHLILATSEADRAVMEAWGNLPPCIVVPNGVDSAFFSPMQDRPETVRSTGIVFTGSMHYSPNAEAMLYFVREIWPLIQERVPGVTLRIVGGDPPIEIQRLGQLPNISVAGYVTDIRPHIESAQVVVAPLRFGGGTRLKIVEALSMGRAVVTTSLGCEGLEVEDGCHLLIADEPAEFASRVVELLQDPTRRSALGLEGRRLVETRYDWHAIGLHMEATLRDLVTSARDEVPHAAIR